jgi:hypothetical protein
MRLGLDIILFPTAAASMNESVLSTVNATSSTGRSILSTERRTMYQLRIISSCERFQKPCGGSGADLLYDEEVNLSLVMSMLFKTTLNTHTARHGVEREKCSSFKTESVGRWTKIRATIIKSPTNTYSTSRSIPTHQACRTQILLLL